MLSEYLKKTPKDQLNILRAFGRLKDQDDGEILLSFLIDALEAEKKALIHAPVDSIQSTQGRSKAITELLEIFGMSSRVEIEKLAKLI